MPCSPPPPPKGPPLAENLRRSLEGAPLLPYVPQATNLALITTGGKSCLLSRPGWPALEGGWLWYCKDFIDRAFMNKYSSLLPPSV